MARRKTFGIVGLGSFGSTVASELTRFGNHVIGVDHDEQIVSALAETLAQTMILDARDEDALREAGFAECDHAVVAVGEHLESNILAAINLKMIGVPLVWAKATTRTHHRILGKLGVDRVIHPEVEIGQHIAQVLHNPEVRDYASLGNGYHVVTFIVPEKIAGRGLAELSHARKHRLRCVGVMRGTEFIGRDGDPCTLAEDDRLMLLGQRKDLRAFADSL